MPKISKDHIKMKVFPKGQVVIPSQEGNIYKSLTEHLFGVFNIYATAKSELTKKDISNAVKRGFTEGYRL